MDFLEPQSSASTASPSALDALLQQSTVPAPQPSGSIPPQGAVVSALDTLLAQSAPRPSTPSAVDSLAAFLAQPAPRTFAPETTPRPSFTPPTPFVDRVKALGAGLAQDFGNRPYGIGPLSALPVEAQQRVNAATLSLLEHGFGFLSEKLGAFSNEFRQALWDAPESPAFKLGIIARGLSDRFGPTIKEGLSRVPADVLFASTPLQGVAEVSNAFSKKRINAFDFLDNVYAAASVGLPFLIAPHEAESPDTPVQLAGSLAIFAGMGALSEGAMLSSLRAIEVGAKAKGMGALAKTTAGVLKAYGQGEGLPLVQRFVGSGLLSAQNDVLYLSALGVKPEDLATQAALDVAAPFLIGGTIVGVSRARRAQAAARAGTSGSSALDTPASTDAVAAAVERAAPATGASAQAEGAFPQPVGAPAVATATLPEADDAVQAIRAAVLGASDPATDLAHAISPRVVAVEPKAEGGEMYVLATGADRFAVAKRSPEGSVLVLAENVSQDRALKIAAEKGGTGATLDDLDLAAAQARLTELERLVAENPKNADAARAEVLALDRKMSSPALETMFQHLEDGLPLTADEFAVFAALRRAQATEREAVEFSHGAGQAVDVADGSVLPFTGTSLRATEGMDEGVPPAGGYGGAGTPPAGPPPSPPGGAGGPPSQPPINVARAQAKFNVGVHQPAQLGALNKMRSWLSEKRAAFRERFVYEANMQKWPSTVRLPDGSQIEGLNFADDIQEMNRQIRRADELAKRDMQAVAGVLQRVPKAEQGKALDDFNRIVALRDFRETAERGLQLPGLPGDGLTLDEVRYLLAEAESGASPHVLEAVAVHRKLTNRIRQELIERGKLDVGQGYDSYFPHQVIQDMAEVEHLEATGEPLAVAHPTVSYMRRGKLQEPARGYTRERGGSTKPIQGDYWQVMHLGLRRFYRDNAADDFLAAVERTHAIPEAKIREAITERVGTDTADHLINTLYEHGSITLPGPGYERLGVFRPKPTTFFKTNAIDDATRAMIEQGIRDGNVPAEAASKIREVLAVGGAKQLILPYEIAERLNNFFAPAVPAGLVRTATTLWKRSATFWGLAGFNVLNALGDFANTVRSFPGAVVTVSHGKLNSDVVTAVRAIFAHYRTPIASPQQILSGVVGGLGGYFGAGDSEDSAVERLGYALTAAGFGYLLGTTGFKLGGKQLLPSEVGMAKARPMLEALYDEADRLGAVNNGFVFSAEEMGRQVLGEMGRQSFGKHRTGALRAWDTLKTILAGKPIGDPFNVVGVVSAFEHAETLMAERENILRLASYMHLRREGVPEMLAVKRANAALVDYNRFTEFENKELRGALLPFYAFYKANTVNWAKALLGHDVGGKGKIAAAALFGIFAFDAVSQAWNEQFFSAVERTLPEWQRSQFHLVMGNPQTGEPVRDKNGRAVVVGFQMPYESALEFLGLARPGVVYSQILGMGIPKDESLFGRWRRMEDWDDLVSVNSPLVAPIKGMWDRFAALLTPAIKVPIELGSNIRTFNNSPIVPERYVDTPIERQRWLQYLTDSALRQVREVRKTAQQVKQGRFNPINSVFGAGLPVQFVDPAREAQGRLMEMMDAAEQKQKDARAELLKQIDDLFYARKDFTKPEPGEVEKLQEVIFGQRKDGAVLVKPWSNNPKEQQAALNYYVSKTAKATVARRWAGMTWQERANFIQQMNREPGALETFFYFLNGGTGDELRKSVKMPSGLPTTTR